MPPPRTRWALITGASPGGMGEAEASAFLKRGINVVATSIEIDKKEAVEHVSPEPGTQDGFLVKLYLDVTSEKSIAAAVKTVEQLTDGKLDWLVNNAGYGYYTPILDTNITSAKRSYDVNVFGLISVTQAFFPMLRAAQGTVLNQASIAGLQNFNRPYMGMYSSSKAAVLSLSNTMRLEFKPFGVRVVTLITGPVKTEFFRNLQGAEVPEGSVYGMIREVVNARMRGSLGSGNGHDRFQVARETVDELLREDVPAYVTKGYMAGLLCWLYWLLPTSWADSYNNRGSGLDRLKSLLDGDIEEEKAKSS
ncbi:Short-chain dehydrogenase ptmH [Pseudocercospora fuligena]|uniref:Short-chain dehydrogenase ptmH n=1 Tax=Pseudocercospora fuligena TaxID=685502 RepID=A0A8H6VDQ4_9PEZI|nr:Short-chain dehydrogenase ptmH [Pseudocercospora fuligena]